jgi:hypothetical protein
MWKAALAGAVALATIGSVSVSHDGIGIAPAAAQDVVVSEAQIAQLRNTLRLTAQQEHHWRPVEARLRSLARQREASADGGIVQRVRSSAGYALTAVALQRLKSAAQPLIRALNDEQKQAGLSALQSMGVTF